MCATRRCRGPRGRQRSPSRASPEGEKGQTFGRIGLLSLGGGNAMTKMIEAEACERRGWLPVAEVGAAFRPRFPFPGAPCTAASTFSHVNLCHWHGLGVMVLVGSSQSCFPNLPLPNTCSGGQLCPFCYGFCLHENAYMFIC